MLFSSIEFLYWFLPVVLVLYFAVPFRLKNYILLAASLFFYFYGEKAYSVIMVGSILISYVSALLTDWFRGTKWSKFFLWLAVLVCLGLLGYFKYADFTIRNINGLLGTKIPLVGVALPIGISFYTFQTLSYNIDVYRGTVAVQKNPCKLITYVSLFPQLIAGPIVRYETVEAEISERKHSFEDFSSGVQRFVIGLSKKVLLANLLGELCDKFKALDEKTFVFYWIYAIAFSMHIYFDFSGYSDMAIGLGRVFGFHFLENFNYPYISKSISEFWRRWHISLGTWFREYVYIPLGGNRVSTQRWLLNIFVVWFLTGFWHGSEWNFILWGLYFGVLLALERIFLGKALDRLPAWSRHLYVLFFVVVSFVIFNASGTTAMLRDLGGLFGAGVSGFVDTNTVYYLRSYAGVLVFGVIGVTPLAKTVVQKMKKSSLGAKVIDIATPVFILVMLLTATAYLVDGSFNPFLYFRF